MHVSLNVTYANACVYFVFSNVTKLSAVSDGQAHVCNGTATTLVVTHIHETFRIPIT
jgi:hypothetical protein